MALKVAFLTVLAKQSSFCAIGCSNESRETSCVVKTSPGSIRSSRFVSFSTLQMPFYYELSRSDPYAEDFCHEELTDSCFYLETLQAEAAAQKLVNWACCSFWTLTFQTDSNRSSN